MFVDFWHAVFVATLVGIAVSLWCPGLAPVQFDQDDTDE